MRPLLEVRDRLTARLAARPLLADGLVASLLLALFVLQMATEGAPDPGQRRTDALAALLFAVMIGSYLLHRARPVTATALSLSALMVQALTHGQVYPGVNAFVLLFGIALHCQDRRRRLGSFLATLAALTVAVWMQPAGVATTSTWVSTLLLATLAGLVGENIRHRRARWAALQERARYLESEREERARRAVVDERLRIARELHDVVAHSMSVIAVQAGMGHHVLDSQPEEARRALAAIETTSRAALTEMRRLLGVLRQEGQSRAELSPTPGLADLPLLLTQVRHAGLEVTSTIIGEPACTITPVELTAYRIIQEALTNALKHGGPRACVRIDYGPDELRFEITDDGRPDNGRSGSIRAEQSHPPRQRVTGHGLIGMRERVAVFGGQLDTGPQPGGGYRVAACLPMSRARS